MSLRMNASRYTFISGVHVVEIVLVRGRRVTGSAKTWRVAIIEKTKVMISDGMTIGILIRQAIAVSLQPSSFAASYRSVGIALSAVSMTTMLKPTPPQTAMVATAKNTRSEESRFGTDQLAFSNG